MIHTRPADRLVTPPEVTRGGIYPGAPIRELHIVVEPAGSLVVAWPHGRRDGDEGGRDAAILDRDSAAAEALVGLLRMITRGAR